MPGQQNSPAVLDAPHLSSDSAFSTEHPAHLIGGDAQVEQFLFAHPDLLPLLANALPELRRSFGPSVTLRLWVLHDQESQPRLDARICTTLSMAEARAARAQFNREWWTRQTEAREYPLTFGIELLP